MTLGGVAQRGQRSGPREAELDHRDADVDQLVDDSDGLPEVAGTDDGDEALGLDAVLDVGRYGHRRSRSPEARALTSARLASDMSPATVHFSAARRAAKASVSATPRPASSESTTPATNASPAPNWSTTVATTSGHVITAPPRPAATLPRSMQVRHTRRATGANPGGELDHGATVVTPGETEHGARVTRAADHDVGLARQHRRGLAGGVGAHRRAR